jgi:hypothetical protein
MFEEELQAFGLLEKGDKDLQVERTVTASMLRTLASSLPSGVQDEAEPLEAKLDETTLAKPDETTLAKPDEITLAKPDETTSVEDAMDICKETVAAAKSTRRRVTERSNSDRSYASSNTSDENEGNTGATGITRRRSTRRRTQRTVN